ncbi:MAG: 3-isopropylmalate dehydratase large subunit [Lysobacterales bacterium]|jgi:3-isopropylmalate/(R)-2-methylmalate dehydratase large subunit|nr:MAG: 3-isopropylmalate dehydratase large subunit [Xanthomonadales bacterium]
MRLSLFEKIWRAHQVRPPALGAPAVLSIDLHLVHEVTSPQAFAELARRGLKVRRPERTLATLDHATPTSPADAQGRPPFADEACRAQAEKLIENCADHGIELLGFGSGRRGIVHVIAPELGLTQPGMTIVCGDSHTSTHGAFGALAFGIGSSEVAQVLATQCLFRHKPKSLRIELRGRLRPGISAKDLALALIHRFGTDGGTGHVVEFSGEAVRALSMEARMTLCNMAIEMGAPSALIAPDETTFGWIEGRPRAPKGEAFARACARWQQLQSDPEAVFDRELSFDAGTVGHRISFGTDPAQNAGLDEPLPQPEGGKLRRAYEYMGLEPGKPLRDTPIDYVFIGSCTNGRLEDLREAAKVLAGRRIAPGVRMLVVPGSEQVKRAAEEEGLHRIFLAAGGEWREPGCSMCIAMNGDVVPPGKRCVSTSNRNFEGRQGPGARTLLASPAVAAASAVAGCLTDPIALQVEAAA